MARQQISLKQLAIDKDNSRIVLAIGLASFIVVFSLVACNALLKQSSYQGKVIGLKEDALKQLKENEKEVASLHDSYQSFATEDINVLGGNAKGGEPLDGENPKIILDALPSKYDFPALAASLEKLFRGYSLENIGGTDDEVAQAATQPTSTPQPVEIPFSFSISSQPEGIEAALQQIDKSIRPIQIEKLKIEGSNNQMKVSVDAKTYYQAPKIFDVTREVIK